ncbi:glycolate oxidase subunit GlcE [Oryzibacter oryziterrae]|uniref:glycolate oxidase subunit GlcE n=1 Tax=Oryzibacter oryziterrae TaxID=2766474 RepID=UPI001F02E0A8|nr:glycolate oxidase subunit GlcE [Oryzibacter oryziterrae]
MNALRPDTEADVVEIVRQAIADRVPLAPRGLGSKAGLGRPVEHQALDLSALTGVIAYEPEELVLTVRAGTPVAEVEALLAAQNQHLAFEPIDLAPLYGTGPGSIGGLLAANLAGPRRISAGGVRDHVLGIRAVSGKGEAFKAGGRVVKNVTGYDLPRGLCGSHGTLAVFTEVTLKVMPRPETVSTLCLFGLDDVSAVAALCRAMGSPQDVSGAAHLPLAVASRFGYQTSVTLIRVEGFEASVRARMQALVTACDTSATFEVVSSEASATLWRHVRNAEGVLFDPLKAIWRVSVAPTAGPAVAATLPGVEIVYDWSGGLLWLAVDPHDDAGTARLRSAIAACGGGHATLMRAPEDVRHQVPVFEPQSPVLVALSTRLKAEFDPAGILNPGRI